LSLITRPIRFCHLSNFYPPYSFGGDGTYLYRLANSLAARGHEVDVIHCKDSYDLLAGKNNLAPLPHHPNVTVHTLQSPLGLLSPLLSQQTGRPLLKAAKIRKIFNERKFDVIHYHIISLFGPRVWEIAPDQGPYIKLSTIHEHWLVCPMHVLYRNGNRLCERARCISCALRYGRPPQWWRFTSLLRKSADSLDAFLSPSRFAADLHRQRGFRRAFLHLPNYSSLPEDPSESPLPVAGGRPYFLFVGRLEKIKGLQEVIPVFRNFKNADLIVAGKGNYEASLKRLAQGLSNVHFLGWQPPEALASLYRRAVALLVPSLCYEIFPMVLFEAFSRRTPAIVHALGSLSEIIEDCNGGLAYRNREELIAAMDGLCADPLHRNRLGNSAYRKWQQTWSEDAHLEQYLGIISQIAVQKHGRLPWGGPVADPPPPSSNSLASTGPDR